MNSDLGKKIADLLMEDKEVRRYIVDQTTKDYRHALDQIQRSLDGFVSAKILRDDKVTDVVASEKMSTEVEDAVQEVPAEIKKVRSEGDVKIFDKIANQKNAKRIVSVLDQFSELKKAANAIDKMEESVQKGSTEVEEAANNIIANERSSILKQLPIENYDYEFSKMQPNMSKYVGSNVVVSSYSTTIDSDEYLLFKGPEGNCDIVLSGAGMGADELSKTIKELTKEGVIPENAKVNSQILPNFVMGDVKTIDLRNSGYGYVQFYKKENDAYDITSSGVVDFDAGIIKLNSRNLKKALNDYNNSELLPEEKPRDSIEEISKVNLETLPEKDVVAKPGTDVVAKPEKDVEENKDYIQPPLFDEKELNKKEIEISKKVEGKELSKENDQYISKTQYNFWLRAYMQKIIENGGLSEEQIKHLDNIPSNDLKAKVDYLKTISNQMALEDDVDSVKIEDNHKKR